LPLIVENHIATGEVAYVFWNLPLEFHAQAMPAAEATECAALQGRYWEMHDKIFEEQDSWTGNDQALEIFFGYAADLGLDQDAFLTCISEHQTSQKIEQERAIAQQLGITGTPNFVVRSRGDQQPVLINGAYPYESFQQVIDQFMGTTEP
jgi:protein-disulfide isomerase